MIAFGYKTSFAQWSSDATVNVPICTAVYEQNDPLMISDGSGGAFVAWYDKRNGSDFNIYAQHVNASGLAQWTTNGKAVCTNSANQRLTGMILDGGGGIIVVWDDDRNGEPDIYAQRLNASGTPQWTTNGIGICTAPVAQSLGGVIPDGSGGALLVWRDRRAAGLYDIYAQRINGAGASQWTTNGIAICTDIAEQDECTLISDGAGGAIISWYDFRNGNYDIYGQRISGTGARQWALNGIPICNAVNDQKFARMVSDNAGGAIVVWSDSRIDVNITDIYAQRINGSGAGQWTANGVIVCDAASYQTIRKVASDGSGGMIIAWDDRRNGFNNSDIYAQRINNSGVSQWATNGVAISTAPNNQKISAMTYIPDGGAIISWNDERDYSGSDPIPVDIYAQRVNGSGVVQWITNGVAVSTATNEQTASDIVSDGAGGAIITWADARNLATSDQDLYIQNVHADGTLGFASAWSSNPNLLGSGQHPGIVSDGTNGAIVGWYTGSIVGGQKVNHAGTTVWPGGKTFGSGFGQQVPVSMIPDGSGGTITAWIGGSSVYTQRINASGELAWTTGGVTICTSTNSLFDPSITTDGAGGAFIAWFDHRSGTSIYVQHVNAAGIVLFAANGIAVATTSVIESTNEYGPPMVSDGAGGAIISWRDNRNGNADIYAQRINASGVAQWTVAGVTVCTTSSSQDEINMTGDETSGAVITWKDNRNGNTDIYAQRIMASGITQWTADGVGVCTWGGSDISPVIESDGTGGAIIAWLRSNGVYAQRVRAAGELQWSGGPVTLTNATGATAPSITNDGTGGAIVTWMQLINGQYDIYAQKVIASGAVPWTANGIGVSTTGSNEGYPVIVSNGLHGAFVSWNISPAIPGAVYVQNVNDDGTTGPAAASITTCSTGSISLTSNITGANYQWQLNTGSGFVNISDNSNYSGANSLTLQLNNMPSSWYGNIYRCVVNGNNSVPFKLKFSDNWTGAANNDWSTAGNWSCGTIPDANTDVVINSGTVLVNTNTTVRTLTLAPGVNVTLAPGITLTVLHP